MNNIQWYPGHMTKTRRMMEENISLVDIVIELVDARIPYSSKNPDLDTLAKNKHRILLLNKCDLADERATDIWQEYFEKQGFRVIRINALKGNGLGEVTETARSLMNRNLSAAQGRRRREQRDDPQDRKRPESRRKRGAERDDPKLRKPVERNRNGDPEFIIHN